MDKKMNPIAVIWLGCCGHLGAGWQVVSLVLMIAAFSAGASLWNGLQGRDCNPSSAAVNLRDADKTARLVGCGSRSFLEAIAGEDSQPTEAPAANPDVISVPE